MTPRDAPGVSPPSVVIRDALFEYPGTDFALRVEDLTLEAADSVALIGPSGSGKTTLLHAIAGIRLPARGSVVTCGADMSALDDAGRRTVRIQRIGLVFQEFELLDYLSVIDNILLPFRIHPALELTAEVRERARSWTERVGLGDKQGRGVARLSQGERQRVAVCRALVTEPALILADEPTSNLDPRNKDHVLEILHTFARETGATLLTVTHDRALLAGFRRVVDLADLVACSPPASVGGPGAASRLEGART